MKMVANHSDNLRNKWREGKNQGRNNNHGKLKEEMIMAGNLNDNDHNKWKEGKSRGRNNRNDKLKEGVMIGEAVHNPVIMIIKTRETAEAVEEDSKNSIALNKKRPGIIPGLLR
jgi:hypothetical protein